MRAFKLGLSLLILSQRLSQLLPSPQTHLLISNINQAVAATHSGDAALPQGLKNWWRWRATQMGQHTTLKGHQDHRHQSDSEVMMTVEHVKHEGFCRVLLKISVKIGPAGQYRLSNMKVICHLALATFWFCVFERQLTVTAWLDHVIFPFCQPGIVLGKLIHGTVPFLS